MISHAINGRVPPVWLMGLSNLTLGLTTGIVFFVLPQLLAAVHVSEVKIAAITAVAMSPNFWAVVFSPMLLPKFVRKALAGSFRGFICPGVLWDLRGNSVGGPSHSLRCSCIRKSRRVLV